MDEKRYEREAMWMKVWKRKLAYILVFTFLLGAMSPGMGLVARAEGLPFAEVDFEVSEDGEYLRITGLQETDRVRYIFSNNAAKINVTDKQQGISRTPGYGTLSGKSTKDGKLKKDTSWELMSPRAVVSGGAAGYIGYIDTGWIAKSKAGKLILEMTRGETVLYKAVSFKKQDKSLKVFYGSVQGDKLIHAKNKSKTVAEGLGNVCGSDRTGYIGFYSKVGSSYIPISAPSILWSARVKSLDKEAVSETAGESLADYLPRFMQRGIKLYFCVRGMMGVDSDGNREFSWPSATVSLTYKKQAAAPTVTVDASKLTVNLKSGQEYRIQDENGILHEEWLNVASTYSKDEWKKVPLLSLVVSPAATASDTAVTLSEDALYSGDVELQVRTASVNGTMASKTTVTCLTPISTAASIAIRYHQNDIEGAPVELSFKENNPERGIIVKNNDKNNEYEFAYVKTPASLSAVKWSVLRKEKSATIASRSYGGDAADTGLIYVRMKGAAPKFASRYTVVTVSALTGPAVDVPSPGAVDLAALQVVSAVTAAGTTVGGNISVINKAPEEKVVELILTDVPKSGDGSTGVVVMAITFDQNIPTPANIQYAEGQPGGLVITPGALQVDFRSGTGTLQFQVTEDLSAGITENLTQFWEVNVEGVRVCSIIVTFRRMAD